MRINLRRTEYIFILISIVIISFVLGFDDGQEVFNWSFWFANLFKIFIIVAIGLIVHVLAHKLIARHYNTRAEYRLWIIKRWWFTESSVFQREFPLGVVFPLFVLFFSYLATDGRFILQFIAFETFILTSVSAARLGKKYIHLTEFEESKIAFAGPLASIILAFIFKFLASINPGFSAFVFVNSLIAFYHMLPLPHLDGIKIYFGSKTFYILALVFISASALLLNYASTTAALLLALVFAVVIAISYHYYFRT